MNLIGKMMKMFDSEEEFIKYVSRPSFQMKLRINRSYRLIKRSVRNIIRTPKWWYQRVTRGYSDRDMWNADTYLAGVFAGVLQWYVTKSISVPPSYALSDDPCAEDIHGMVSRRNEEYLKHRAVFREYVDNGLAYNEEWQKEFGGVLEEEMQQSLQWFSEHFWELWD
jgi:hypothetical protein